MGRLRLGAELHQTSSARCPGSFCGEIFATRDHSNSMILRYLRVLTVAAIAVAALSGCKKSPPQQIEILPFPGAAHYDASALGNLTALLKKLPVAERGPAVERFLYE